MISWKVIKIKHQLKLLKSMYKKEARTREWYLIHNQHLPIHNRIKSIKISKIMSFRMGSWKAMIVQSITNKTMQIYSQGPNNKHKNRLEVSKAISKERGKKENMLI